MEKRPTEANVHASCVAIGNKGVLLLGPSGAGKSDLALRLIDEGAHLVSDDRTILFIAKGALHARAPASGLLEVRGGIIALPVRANVKIARRSGWAAKARGRPPPFIALKPIAPPPLIVLNARFASTPAKIRAALAAFSRRSFRDTFHLK